MIFLMNNLYFVKSCTICVILFTISEIAPSPPKAAHASQSLQLEPNQEILATGDIFGMLEMASLFGGYHRLQGGSARGTCGDTPAPAQAC